ncbi:MAG: hypothetical protein J0I09_10580 [Sphingobacteriia bacterium]|nr:hypothetical protein [Sphingobacteriia bacterium]
MLIKNFFLHQLKAFIRNENWRRNLIGKIILAIVAANTIFIFFFFGIFIREILQKFGNNLVKTFNSTILFYIAADLFLRCFFQTLPNLHVAPYLRLCISRKKIIWFLLFKSFLNLFNLLPWLILIPVAVSIITPTYGMLAALLFVSVFMLLLVLNNAIAVLYGLLSKRNITYIVFVLAIPVALFLLEQINVSIYHASLVFGNWLLTGNFILIIVLAALILGALMVIFQILSNELYLDELTNNKHFQFISGIADWDGVTQTSEISQLIWLEVNLLLRNKRTQQLLSMIPIFIGYFLFMLTNDHGKNHLLMLFLIPLAISFGSSMYGQMIFSWESAYFDILMVLKINFSNYIKAKYYIIAILSLLTTILFYVVLLITNKVDLSVLLSFLVFNLGVTPFIILLFACFNDGRIDLSRKQYFNYQGLKGSQMILSILLVLLPVGIYKLFNFLFDDFVGKMMLIIIGGLFVLTHNWWIKQIIATLFLKRKYKNLYGYRKLSI